MKVYAVVLGLVILFVSGSLTSEVVMRRRQEASQPSSTSSSRVEHLREDGVNTSKAESVAGGGGGSGRASKAAASSGDNSAAQSDIAAAAGNPETKPSSDVDADALRFLSENFGPALAPPSAAGFRLSKSADKEGLRIIAVYAGAASTSCDVLQLVVLRAKDEAEAEKITRGHASQFPQSPITYSWGGRRITQGMTQEDRPETFPPALSFAWRRGNYAIQVSAVPLAPASVRKARDKSLGFISALRY